MLDDTTRATHEAEALALVNLSNSRLACAQYSSLRTAHMNNQLVPTQTYEHMETPMHMSTPYPIHPMDTNAPTRGARTDTTFTMPFATAHNLCVESTLSAPPNMFESVTVPDITVPSEDCWVLHHSPNHPVAYEINQMGDFVNAPHVEQNVKHFESSHHQCVPARDTGKLISIQSMLVHSPGDKRKTTSGSRPPSKLPRFHEVFQSPRHSQQGPVLHQRQEALSLHPQQGRPIEPMSSTDPVNTTGSLKCKYRTGKCSNDRALKSCGGYHNLCNYHRLRANANQRKLDRKKKIQRGYDPRPLMAAEMMRSSMEQYKYESQPHTEPVARYCTSSTHIPSSGAPATREIQCSDSHLA